MGLRPKETARVVRFDRARRLLHAGVRLGDVAADAGYFDQAHLNREFRALAGLSPTAVDGRTRSVLSKPSARRAAQDEWHD